MRLKMGLATRKARPPCVHVLRHVIVFAPAIHRGCVVMGMVWLKSHEECNLIGTATGGGGSSLRVWR